MEEDNRQRRAAAVRFAVDNLNNAVEAARGLGLKVAFRPDYEYDLKNMAPSTVIKNVKLERIWFDQRPIEY